MNVHAVFTQCDIFIPPENARKRLEMEHWTKMCQSTCKHCLRCKFTLSIKQSIETFQYCSYQTIKNTVLATETLSHGLFHYKTQAPTKN